MSPDKADDVEELLTLKEFQYLFGGSLTHLRKRAKAGRWPEARLLGGRWHVLMEQRLVKAARNRKAA